MATDSNWSDLPLGGIVGHAQPPVIEEARQSDPSGQAMAAKVTIVLDVGPDVPLTVLPFARIGTVVSSPCSRSAARAWASISAWSGRKTIAQAPTWGLSGILCVRP